MAAMTNVDVPAGDTWTLAYTAAGTKTIKVHNRSNIADLLVRVDGSSGDTGDDKDSPAIVVHCFAFLEMTLATGDKVFCRAIGSDAGRATVLA